MQVISGHLRYILIFALVILINGCVSPLSSRQIGWPILVPTADKAKIEKLLPSASSGDVDAQFAVGNLYDFYNIPEAFFWYEKAAASGHRPSVGRVRKYVLSPYVVPKVRMDQFEKLLERAEAGDLEAQFQVGKCYGRGDPVPVDYIRAAFWYDRAASSGSYKGAYAFGYYNGVGLGMAQDFVKANDWFKSSGVIEPEFSTTVEHCFQVDEIVVFRGFLQTFNAEKAANSVYPLNSLRMGAGGSVVVSMNLFDIDNQDAVAILESSQNQELDGAALSSVRQALKRIAAPEFLKRKTTGRQCRLMIPFSFLVKN